MTSRSSLAALVALAVLALSLVFGGPAIEWLGAHVDLPRPSGFADPAETVTVPARSIGLVDGDTVRYRGERLRLVDIDTPEIGSAECARERRAGEAARAALRSLLGRGFVDIHYSGRRDRYGRPLVSLEANGADVGKRLIASGMALRFGAGRAAMIARWCGRRGQ